MRPATRFFLPLTITMIVATNASAGWRWERLDKPSPPSMYGHSMVYASLRDRLVVYGGATYYSESQGTHHYPYVWEWDGEIWRMIEDSAMSEDLVFGAMAFDTKRGVAVHFGGIASSERNATHEWDGVKWTEVGTRTRPSRRHSHAMAYDERRGVTVMFGGAAGYSPYGDTWEYNGSAWRAVASSGPTPRYAAGMTYDVERGKVILHGGRTSWNGPSLSDTWEWDGLQWVKIDLGNTAPGRSWHTLTYDPQRRASILVDGIGKEPFEVADTVWEFRGEHWELSRATHNLYPRSHHAAAYHPVLGKVAVFGGQHIGRRFSDLWFFDGQAWIDDDPAPPAHKGTAMVFDNARNSLVLFGGNIHSSNRGRQGLQGGTWVYTPQDGWHSASRGLSPAPRAYAAFVYDEDRQEAVLFGGRIYNRYGNVVPARDTWIWNGSSWCRPNTVGAIPPQAGPMFYDPNLRKIVLVSLRTGTQETGATWLWNGAAWEETNIDTPSYTTDAVYDRHRKVGVLRGWTHNLTWLWDGVGWQFVYEDDAGVRRGAATVFDEHANMTFCYGGYVDYGGSLLDATVWNGATWKSLGVQPPGKRSGASIAFDPYIGRSVLFGGLAYSYEDTYYEYYDDTWALTWVE
ncbi:MAG: kelch repeat-containing protein [Fimbriimonadales bacterium]